MSYSKFWLSRLFYSILIALGIKFGVVTTAYANGFNQNHHATHDFTGQLLHIGSDDANASLGVVNHGRETGAMAKVTLPIGQNALILGAFDKSHNETHALLSYGQALPKSHAYVYGTISTAQEKHFDKTLKGQGASVGVSHFPNNEHITSFDANIIIHRASDVQVSTETKTTSSTSVDYPTPNTKRTTTTHVSTTHKQMFDGGMTGYANMGMTLPVGQNGEFRAGIQHQFWDNNTETYVNGQYTHYFNDDKTATYVQTSTNKNIELGVLHNFDNANWSIHARTFKTPDDVGGAVGLTYHFDKRNTTPTLRTQRTPEDAHARLYALMSNLNTTSLDTVKNLNTLGQLKNLTEVSQTTQVQEEILPPVEISNYLTVTLPSSATEGDVVQPTINKGKNPNAVTLHSSDESVASIRTNADGTPHIVFHKNGTVRILAHIDEYYDATTNTKYKAEQASQVIQVQTKAPTLHVVTPNIQASKLKTEVKVGDTDKLTILGDNVKVRFVSTNPAIASIDENGNITYHQKGQVKFHAIFDGYFDTATNTQYDGVAVYTNTITVNEQPKAQNIATEITLTPSLPASAQVGDTFQLNVVTNHTGGAGVISYKSSNEKVLVVDKTGLVTFVGEGTASITVDVAPHHDMVNNKQYSANKKLVGSVSVKNPAPVVIPPTVSYETKELIEKQGEFEVNHKFDINYLLKNGWEIQEIGKVVNQEGEIMPEELMEINTTTGIISFFQHIDDLRKPYGTKHTYTAQVTYFNKKENKLLTITYNYSFFGQRV